MRTQQRDFELIEVTRQLMEQTIEFVAHPVFRRSDATRFLKSIRPESIDRPVEVAQTRPGLAFVPGLVQSPLLTPEEERYWFTWMNFLKSRAERNRRRLDLGRPDRSLVSEIRADLLEANRVRNRIVQANLRLVVALAKKLATSLDQMSELISEGMTPLIRAVELFDIHLGNRFSTYATWAIRNQMHRWLKRSRLAPDSSCREDTPSLENLPDPRPPAESDESGMQKRLAVIARLLSLLTERERSILKARFGLDGQPHGRSLADIAMELGLSKEGVRQIVIGSLAKLRDRMTSEGFGAK